MKVTSVGELSSFWDSTAGNSLVERVRQLAALEALGRSELSLGFVGRRSPLMRPRPSSCRRLLPANRRMAEAGKAIAGAGAKEPLDTIARIVKDHGGDAADGAKKTSSTFQARDGSRISTHWLENGKTGQRVEFKTIANE